MAEGVAEKAVRDRLWVHPSCAVRPLVGQSLVQDFRAGRKEHHRWMSLLEWAPDDRSFNMGFARYSIEGAMLERDFDTWRDQEEGDECWLHSRKRIAPLRRRLMAEQMGLYPAFSDPGLEAYDYEMAAIYDGKLWVACRWGGKRCVRPSHLVVGRFAGLNAGMRLLKSEE